MLTDVPVEILAAIKQVSHQALTDRNISAMPVAPESVPVRAHILDDVRTVGQFISAVSSRDQSV